MLGIHPTLPSLGTPCYTAVPATVQALRCHCAQEAALSRGVTERRVTDVRVTVTGVTVRHCCPSRVLLFVTAVRHCAACTVPHCAACTVPHCVA